MTTSGDLLICTSQTTCPAMQTKNIREFVRMGWRGESFLERSRKCMVTKTVLVPKCPHSMIWLIRRVLAKADSLRSGCFGGSVLPRHTEPRSGFYGFVDVLLSFFSWRPNWRTQNAARLFCRSFVDFLAPKTQKVQQKVIDLFTSRLRHGH